MQIIQQSGHTACEHCGARPRWCRPFFLKVFSFYLRTRNLGMFIKWANHGLFLFIFVLFTFLSKWQIYNLNRMNWKKRRWCAGDSNWGDRIEGADESTELWLPPYVGMLKYQKFHIYILYVFANISLMNYELWRQFKQFLQINLESQFTILWKEKYSRYFIILKSYAITFRWQCCWLTRFFKIISIDCLTNDERL